MMDERETVAQLYRDLCAHSIAKDADGLRALLAPEYRLVHMTGMEQSGEQYIAAVLDGTLNYYSSVHDSIDVQIAADGKHATVCGCSRTMAAVFGGGRRTWRLRQDLEAVRRDGTWKLTASRASTY